MDTVIIETINPMSNIMISLTRQIKAFAIDEGADLVGIAPVSRWKNAPIELSPQGIWPEAKSIIVIAVNLGDAGTELSGVDDPQKACFGELTGLAWCRLDHISFRIGKFIEKKGFHALPIVCTSLWRYRPYGNIDNANSFLPDISHVHAGAAAGLGDIGYSGLLITPEYGPRVRLSTIITDALLEPDPLYNGMPLCDRCKMCVKVCKESCARALCEETEGECVVKIEDKVYRYVKINKWRCAWGEHFALDLEAVSLPEKITETTVVEHLEKYDVKGWLNGRCQKYCLPPHLRFKDPDYCKPWRRKRQFGVLNEYPANNRVVADEINRIAVMGGGDLVEIVPLDDLRKQTGLNLKDYLPDAESAVLLGIDNVKGDGTEDISYERADYPRKNELEEGLQEKYLASDAAQQRLVFVGMDVTKYIESLGYSALCCIQTLGPFVKAMEVFLGEDKKNLKSGLIVTSIPLPANGQKLLTTTLKPLTTTAKENPGRFTEEIRTLGIQRGADIIGIAPLERFNEMERQLEETIKKEKNDYFIVQDIGRVSKGPFIPRVVSRKLKVKTPCDYLPDAKSVIVLGMHYFDVALDRAGEPPAEAVGPYGFSQSETISQLDDIALDIMKSLKENGYKAAFSYDLSGLAGLTAGSCASGRSYYGMPWRGPLYPDATANCYAAIAAGLGELGWHGLVLTPEYGVRQRFVSIITNALLTPDRLYNGHALCKRCLKCADSCPVGALSKDRKIMVKIEDRIYEYGACERLRCDWAKRYALVGDAGPKYIGSQTDIMPPKEITAENLCEALKQMDPLQKACMVIVEKCVRACSLRKA